MRILLLFFTVGFVFGSPWFENSYANDPTSEPTPLEGNARIEEDSDIIELVQNEKHPWSLGDRVCIKRGEEDLCGLVVLVTPTQASVKLEAQSLKKVKNQQRKKTKKAVVPLPSPLPIVSAQKEEKPAAQVVQLTPPPATTCLGNFREIANASPQVESKEEVTPIPSYRWFPLFEGASLFIFAKKGGEAVSPHVSWRPQWPLGVFLIRGRVGLTTIKYEEGAFLFGTEFGTGLGYPLGTFVLEAGPDYKIWMGNNGPNGFAITTQVSWLFEKNWLEILDRLFVGYEIFFPSQDTFHLVKLGAGFTF